MRKLFLAFLILQICFISAQIEILKSEVAKDGSKITFDSTKSFNTYRNVEQFKTIIGKKLYGIPMNDSLNEEIHVIPGLYYFQNNEYKEIKDIATYNLFIAGNYFTLLDVKKAEKPDYYNLINIYLESDGKKIMQQSTFSILNENTFEVVANYEFLKHKIINKKFFIEPYEGRYSKSTSTSDFSQNDLFNGISIGFKTPESKFSRVLNEVIILKDSEGIEKEIKVKDFNFNLIIPYSFYENILLTESNNSKSDKIEKDLKAKIILKKYGLIIGKRINNEEVWVGMTKQMLIDSQGKDYRIGSIVDAENYYSLEVIYGNTYYTFVNGKLDTIISL